MPPATLETQNAGQIAHGTINITVGHARLGQAKTQTHIYKAEPAWQDLTTTLPLPISCHSLSTTTLLFSLQLNYSSASCSVGTLLQDPSPPPNLGRLLNNSVLVDSLEHRFPPTADVLTPRLLRVMSYTNSQLRAALLFLSSPSPPPPSTGCTR